MFERLTDLLDRHKPRALMILAVVVTIGLFAIQVWPGLQDVLIQKGVFVALTLLLVIDMVRRNALRTSTDSLTTLENQDDSLPLLVQAVSECRRQSIDLLEFAGGTTLPLIREVRRQSVPLRLLLKHPKTVEGMQRHRMITALDEILVSVFGGYTGDVQVRCYRQPYSLRGRRMGDHVLELGWLTPDFVRQTAHGHSNPCLHVDLSVGAHKYLLDFFNKTFDDLWEAPNTEDAQTVYARMRQQHR